MLGSFYFSSSLKIRLWFGMFSNFFSLVLDPYQDYMYMDITGEIKSYSLSNVGTLILKYKSIFTLPRYMFM